MSKKEIKEVKLDSLTSDIEGKIFGIEHATNILRAVELQGRQNNWSLSEGQNLEFKDGIIKRTSTGASGKGTESGS